MFFRNNLRLLWIAIITAVIVFLPQMMYWKMISGKWIFYSYGEEGFIHWENPQLLKVWFSTNNGFFVYAPIMILSVIGMITMIRKKISNGALIFSIFILASYAFASWWNWWFGCSYGSRSFIEFYALLNIPLAWFLESLKTKNSKWAAAVFILACIAINMNIIYYYDGCFWGGDWDWMAYFKLHQ
jgi:hypothetical protein